jgi:nitrogenase molybdenum-iron protein alpha/beta subunit
MEDEAVKVIEREIQEVKPEIEHLRKALSGKTAIIEISEFPGPIRALSLARMAAEFGAHPVVINVHPYTIKERMPSIKFLLETGVNPDYSDKRALPSGEFSVIKRDRGRT